MQPQVTIVEQVWSNCRFQTRSSGSSSSIINSKGRGGGSEGDGKDGVVGVVLDVARSNIFNLNV